MSYTIHRDWVPRWQTDARPNTKGSAITAYDVGTGRGISIRPFVESDKPKPKLEYHGGRWQVCPVGVVITDMEVSHISDAIPVYEVRVFHTCPRCCRRYRHGHHDIWKCRKMFTDQQAELMKVNRVGDPLSDPDWSV